MLNLRKFLLLLSFVYAHKDLSLELRLGLATALEDGGLIRPVGPTAWPPTVCDMECFAAGVSAYFSVAGVCFKKYNGDVVKAMECIEVTAPEAVAAATALCVKTNPACKPKAAAGLRLHQSPFRGVGAQQAHAFLDRELPKLLGGAGMSLPESLAGVKFDAQEVVQGMAGKDVDVRELYI